MFQFHLFLFQIRVFSSLFHLFLHYQSTISYVICPFISVRKCDNAAALNYFTLTYVA